MSARQPTRFLPTKPAQIFAAWLLIKMVIDRRVSNYDPSLPIAFHCPQCKKTNRLRGGEAEKQTPKDFLSRFLSFKCPGCQTMLKAKLDQTHWVNDAAGQKSVFVLDRIEFA